MVAALAFVALTALLVAADGQALGTGTCAAFYFALILLVSLAADLLSAVLVAVASGLAVNWYFTPPIHTFDIADPDRGLTAGKAGGV